METSDKYRKQNESFVPHQVHYHKNFKYHLSHERFVVPWQMDNVEPVKGKEKY